MNMVSNASWHFCCYISTWFKCVVVMSKMLSGESQNNVTGHIGGDSSLTKRGHSYAKMLGEYVRQLPHPK